MNYQRSSIIKYVCVIWSKVHQSVYQSQKMAAMLIKFSNDYD